MSMNINTILKKIKRDIGIYGIALPIDNLDEAMMDIIADTTLPDFSNYCPDIQKSVIDLSNAQCSYIDNTCNLYILPDYGVNILYVLKLQYQNNYMHAAYSPSLIGLTPNIFEDVLTANIEKKIGDVMINSITHEYEWPRKLYIYDALVSSSLIATIGVEHKSVQTIKPTQAQSFYKLADLDVKAGLYPTIKHFNGIETALERIELNLSDWESAADKREELIKEWDESHPIDLVGYSFN